MTIVKKYKEYIILFFVAFLFVSPQLYYHSMIVSNDWWFHWSRFYETAMQIKNGHFNYFQSIYAYSQSGRVINAMYGGDFAYLHGLILLVFGSWLRAEIVSGFLCSFIAGLTMFKLSRFCGISKPLSLVMGIFFMGTPPIVSYILDQSFPGWASAFLPLCFIPAIQMLKLKTKQINPLFFGGAVALLISIHTFTALMYVVAIVPFWIVGIFRSKERLVMLRDSILSVGVALILGANTFFSMFELSSNRMVMPFLVDDMLSKSTFFSASVMNRYDFGLIYSFIILITIIMGITFFSNMEIFERVILFVGIVFLLLSSQYIPWNSLANHIPMLKGLQFPQRFAAISNVLFLLSNGFIMMRLGNILRGDSHKIFVSVMLTVSLLSCTWGYNSLMKKAQQWQSDNLTMDGDRLIDDPEVIRQKFRSADLSDAFDTIRKNVSDYIPQYDTVETPYWDYRRQIYDNAEKFTKVVNKDNNLVIKWKQKKAEKTQVPVFIYNNSTIISNGKKIVTEDAEKTNIGALIVQGKSGDNEIIVGYEPSLLFRVGVILKVISIPLFIAYCIKYRKFTSRKK